MGSEFLKPNPVSLFQLLKICKIDASEAVYVGNAEEDIQYAKLGDIGSIHITPSLKLNLNSDYISINTYMDLFSSNN